MGDPGTVLLLVVLVDLGLLPSLDQLPIRLIGDRLKGMAVEYQLHRGSLQCGVPCSSHSQGNCIQQTIEWVFIWELQFIHLVKPDLVTNVSVDVLKDGVSLGIPSRRRPGNQLVGLH
jgi:hypothetical protein